MFQDSQKLANSLICTKSVATLASLSTTLPLLVTLRKFACTQDCSGILAQLGVIAAASNGEDGKFRLPDSQNNSSLLKYCQRPLVSFSRLSDGLLRCTHVGRHKLAALSSLSQLLSPFSTAQLHREVAKYENTKAVGAASLARISSIFPVFYRQLCFVTR